MLIIYKLYIHVVIMDFHHMNIRFDMIYMDFHDDPNVFII